MMPTGENVTIREKTRLSATLSTTNLTWTGLELNLGLCGEKPALNRRNHGTTKHN
jgi:hypothetical protein